MSKKGQVSTNPGATLVDHMAVNIVPDKLTPGQNERKLDEFLADIKGESVATGSDKESFSLTDIPTEETVEEVTEQPVTTPAPIENVVVADNEDLVELTIDGVVTKVPKLVANKLQNLEAMRASATQKFQQASAIKKDVDRLSQVEAELERLKAQSAIADYCNEYDVSQNDFVSFCNQNRRDGANIQDYILAHKTAVYEGQAKLTAKPTRGKFASIFNQTNRPDTLSVNQSAPVKKVSPAQFLVDFYSKKK